MTTSSHNSPRVPIGTVVVVLLVVVVVLGLIGWKLLAPTGGEPKGTRVTLDPSKIANPTLPQRGVLSR